MRSTTTKALFRSWLHKARKGKTAVVATALGCMLPFMAEAQCPITTFPHTQNFDAVTAPALPCGWTALNVNNDSETWETGTLNPSSAPNSLVYSYNSAQAANDWVFSPSIAMNAANQYVVSFKYRVRDSSYPEALEVKWGNAATVAGMTATIFSNSNLTNETYATVSAVIAPTATGNFYLGFHAMSPADMWDLYIDDVTITELAPCSGAPVAGTLPAGPIVVCPGSATPITATGATQGGGITYQWEQSASATGPWANATGGTGATTTSFTPPTVTTATYYRLKVTCANSNQTGTTAAVQVTPPPTITSFPYTENFDGATLPALPCGWTITDSNNDGFTWFTTDFLAASGDNSLVYAYNSTNTTIGGNDWAFSPALALTAGNQYNISFKYRVDSDTWPEGLEVKIGNAATAAGMTTSLYNNTNLTAEIFTTVTATFTPTTSGTYYLGIHEISAPDRSALFIDDVMITELAPCSGTPEAGTAPATIPAVCAGGTQTLAVTGASSGLGITYQWEQATSATGPWANVTGGTGATTASFTTPAITATTFYRLKVTCTNGNQTATSAAIEVTVSNPTVSASTGDSRCGSGAVTLSATPSTGAGIAWYTAATGGSPVSTSNTYSPNVTATTTYYAAATTGSVSTLDAHPLTGGNGCAGGNMFNITPATSLRITGMDLNLAVAAGTSTPVSIYYKTGTYLGSETSASAWTLHQTVTVTSAGANTATNVQINPLQLASGQVYGIYVNADVNYTNITGATPYSNADLTLTAGSGLCSLFGGNNPNRAWNGKVYYRTGCESARVPVVATVNPAPVVNLGADISVCGTASFTLNANNPGATYQWSLNGNAIPGATNQTLTATTAGTYSVTVTSGGCSASDDVVISFGTAPSTPAITVAPGSSSTICQGGSAVLNGVAFTPNVTYTWSRNGAPISGATTTSYTATLAGDYRIIAHLGGCSDSSGVITVTVNPLPATPTVSLNGNTLTASFTTGTYQWYSVSGTTLTPVAGATAATFTPTVNGSYTVRVTVNGCESSAATATQVILGMSKLAPGMDVSVYPNPTAGKFAVQLKGFEKEATIQIISVTGQVVATEKVVVSSAKTSKAFNLTGMAKGVYILKVTSGDNLTFRKVILD